METPTNPGRFTKDDTSRLAVDERDRLAVKIMVEGFANDSSGAEIARQLVAANALRRRRPSRQSATTVLNFVTAQNERSRTERAVSMFRERMPDLAMGKHVVRVKEPAATNFTHRGVRRERDGTSGETHHVLVWEVPDIFDHIDEGVLEAALLVVSRRLSRAGERPSQWIHECQQRELVLADMADAGDDEQDARRTARRRQQANEMSRPIGSGRELPRSTRVREIVALAQDEVPRTNRNSSVPNTIRLFSGYPTWPQPDDHEYKLAGHRGGTYVLLKRQQDEGLSAAASLQRPWGIASNSSAVERFAVARFRFDQFHACLADAAAQHINDGVTVLTGQRAAAGGIVMASQHLEAERVLRRQRLSRDLTAAESEVRAAKARLRAVTDYGAEQQDNPDAEEWSSVNGELMREALQDEVQARARVKRINEALERLADEAVLGKHEEMPELDDLTVALQTLVALRTKVMARTEQAQAIQSLIPRLNCVSISAFDAEFEMDLLLPTRDGALPVGPIRFNVPTAGTRPIGYESWSHAECEELTFRRLTMEDTKETRHGSTLANGWLIPKTYVAQRGADYLIKRGVRQKQARYLLQTTLLLPRIVVFHLIHNMTLDHETLGTSDEYVDLVRRTYLTEQAVPVRVPRLTTRDELQHLINHMKTLKHWRPTEIADYLGFPSEDDPKLRDIRASNRLIIQRENLPSVVTRVGVRGLSREGKRMKNLTAYVPHQCPHCAEAGEPHPIDIVAWNAEVPDGMMCSRCLRTPKADSIVYPAAYRELLQTAWERPQPEVPPGSTSDG